MIGQWVVDAVIRYSTNGVRVYEQLGAGANTLAPPRSRAHG